MENTRREGFASRIVRRPLRRRADTFLFLTDDGGFLEARDITDKLRRQALRDRRESVHVAGNAWWTFRCDRLQ